MIYSGVSKHVVFSCEDLDQEEEYDMAIPITEDFKDILAYLFEKRFEVPYTETGWLIEPGAREFVNDLENKWLHNEIDTFELYHDSDFLEFLSKHSNATIDEELEDAYSDFLFACEWSVRAMSKRALKDLIEETCGTVDVEAYIDGEPQHFIRDTIDLEDIYDEEYDDEEDEEEDDD